MSDKLGARQKDNRMTKCILISLLFILLTFSFCTQKMKTYQLDKKVQTLVDSLSQEKIVLMDDTKEIKKFQALLDVTSDKDLLYLTDHEKTVIRCYAFRGLAERNYIDIKEIFYKHLKDTASIINYMTGTCLPLKVPVNDFMLDQLHSFGSKCKYKLDRTEYEKYAKLIHAR